MPVTRCAVIGAGRVGGYHAEKYAALPNAELIAVADTDAQRASQVAAACGGCAALSDYRALLGDVAAVSIAVPTSHHFEVARAFLEHGTHVLIEKPIAAALDEARALTRLAREHGAVLQVGHVERFNPAVVELHEDGARPLFIESHRLASFSQRAVDVDVVLDLMIHDLDIVLQLVRSPVASVRACGASVLSDKIDIANARLEFANGCVANITASRVSAKVERRMRVFLQDAYVAIDFQARGVEVQRVSCAKVLPNAREIVREARFFGAGDAIRSEIVAFLASVQSGAKIMVSGEEGAYALEMALRVAAQIHPPEVPLGA